MYSPQSLHDLLFLLLYGGVTMLALLAGVYLALRRHNGFSSDVIPPVALRRWTAAFLVMAALSHVWWYVLGIYWLTDDRLVRNIVAVTLDHVLLVPLVIALLLRMLQDRRRRLWPWVLTQVPIALSAAVGIIMHDAFYGFDLPTYWQVAVMALFLLYYIRALLQYGRWLHDNYADLEHKEVWQSLLVLAVIMFLFVYYVMGYGSITYEYIIQVSGLLLIGHLLWRVETLQDLSFQPMADGDIALAEAQRAAAEADEADDDALDGDGGRPQPAEGLSEAAIQEIGKLLHDRCEGNKLYLQTDLTSVQLAQALGTNRTYLSLYFSRQGTTYNAYINDLRIDCFVRLVREANAAQRPFTAQELAAQSGYRSYRTFSVAFRQRKGQSVTAWMNEEESA